MFLGIREFFRLRNAVTAGVLFIFFAFLPVLPAKALIVSPAIKKIYAKPGEQIIEVVTIANDTGQPFTLSPVVENFRPKDQTGTPEFLGDMDTEGAARWIQLPFKKIELKPHERKDFLFKINIPRWAVPGGHYAALFWRTGTEKQQGIGSVSRVGSLFLFGVQGDITGGVRMSDWRVVKNEIGATSGFAFKIENKSNIHITPKGRIEIYNLFGRRVSELPLNVQGRNVLAQSGRNFFEKWSRPYFSWGKLRARVVSEFDFNFPMSESEIMFYNLPRFAGVKILLVLICAAYLAVKIHRRRRLKKEHGLILNK